MFGDPVTLSALRLLFPLFKCCEVLYRTWRLTQDFGNDLFGAETLIDAQYARLDQIGSRRRDQLVDPPDPNDDFHSATREIHQLLLNIKMTFDKCEKLIQEVKRKAPPFSSLSRDRNAN
jgi:hypothetical protein